MNHKKHLQHLLKKYLNNSCTESEMKELLNILKKADNEPEVKRLLNQIWEDLDDSQIFIEDHSQQDRDLWFEKIYSEARQRENPSFDKELKKVVVRKKSPFYLYHHSLPQWMKVAALLLFSVFLSLVYYQTVLHEEPEEAVAYAEKVAAPGEKVRFILSDGTQVHLNSGSRLEYPTTFDGALREVRLEGEAYFDVTRDTSHPFVVHTGEITTKVLGTSFDVRSFPEEEEVMVAVAEGKVAVLESGLTLLEDNYGVVLEANQWTHYTSQDQSFRTQNGDISSMVAWNDDVLMYRDSELQEVAYQFERWYGVKIEFKNEAIKHCVIRGEHRRETLENVLESITYAFIDMEYEIQGRRVTLMGKGCK